MTRKYAISVRGKDVDLRKMNRDEVIELKDELIDQLTSIKDQIANAKRKVYTDGIYADPEWFNSAEKARRHVGKTVLKINRWLGKMKKERQQTQPF